MKITYVFSMFTLINFQSLVGQNLIMISLSYTLLKYVKLCQSYKKELTTSGRYLVDILMWQTHTYIWPQKDTKVYLNYNYLKVGFIQLSCLKKKEAISICLFAGKWHHIMLVKNRNCKIIKSLQSNHFTIVLPMLSW